MADEELTQQDLVDIVRARDKLREAGDPRAAKVDKYLQGEVTKFRARQSAPQLSPDSPVMQMGPLEGITKSQFRKITATLPWIGGGAGGILGTPGVATAIGGAALGGGAGSGLEKILNLAFGVDKPETQTSEQNAKDIALSAGVQGAMEAGGQALAPAMKAAAPALRESAEKSMSEALGATKQGMKLQSEKVVPGLVDRRVTAMTRQGLLDKTTSALEDAREALNVALDKVPSDLTPDKKAAISELETVKQKFLQNRDVTSTPEFDRFDQANKAILAAQKGGAYPGEIADLIKQRDAAERALMNLPKLEAKPSAIEAVNGLQQLIKDSDPSVFGIRKLKSTLDNLVDRKSGYLVSDMDYTTREMQRSAADSLRRILVNASKGNGAQAVTAANKEFSFWKGATDVLTETISRTKPQVGGLRGTVATAAGAASAIASGGTVGKTATMAGVFKMMQSLIDSTAWKTISASQKDRLAKVLATGDASKAALFITRLGGAGVSAIRAGDEPPEQ